MPTPAEATPVQPEALYKQILSDTPGGPQSLQEQETALLKLGELYRDQKNAQGLADLITSSRTFMSSTAKAKTAKLIRTLLSFLASIPSSTPLQISTLQTNIAWAKSEKRVFLKHSLETRLVALHLEAGQFKEALSMIEGLLAELKRLDDKMILTEVHLLESRVYRGVGNMAKAKAALTSARTAANAIYCPPPLQSALDLQSGILHAEDKDYTTAYSYFFEAFENMSTHGEEGALGALKYMLLCKVMLNLTENSVCTNAQPEDVTSLLSIKLALKYAQLREVESMRAIALAHQARNLADFERVLKEYKDELSSDPTIRSHLAALYDTLLEQNLLRIVEPYSVVEIEYVAEQVGQGRQDVEAKLSQMILDKVLHGVLDQGRGCLILFDEPEADNTYGAAIETLAQVGKVVESLYAKSVPEFELDSPLRYAAYADPVTTLTCAHTFCKDCIHRALEHAEHCPIDRSPLSANNLAPANPIVRSRRRQLVDELIVECVHREEGCMHTCQRQLLAGHLAERCVYREVQCPQGKCEERMMFKDSKEHVHDDEGESDELAVATPPDQTTTDSEESRSVSPSPDDVPNVSHRIAELTAQNITLRQRVDTLESFVSTLRREMSAVKHALGPWIQASNVSPSRYYSTEMPVDSQPATASTSARLGDGTAGVERPQPRYQPSLPAPNASLLPSADSLAPYFPTEHEFSTTYRPLQQHHRTSTSVSLHSESYEAYTPTHPLVAPLNLGTTLEGTLHGLRESVVGLATGVDGLGRRQEIALSNEATRMAEEVGSLRLNLQGLRMQMHTIMMDRNAQLTGRDGVENMNYMNGQWMGAARGFYGQPVSGTKL
ncbi:hypothetical protein C0995_015836 [Termitomyces sp. Mi166|nr:hypothetical protein C0995_015836 [Termitomyces sp. Mi166\